MAGDAFTPDLSKLESDYEILSELRQSANSRTYLARHLGLNRDVAITIFESRTSGSDDVLRHFSSDARLLTEHRHPNVIPVIEGRPLRDGVFAVVRPRVRGSTLDELIAAEGALPAPRVAATLDEVQSALRWARDLGVMHRHVSGDAIVFQQGSGRALLELDPLPLANSAATDECDDARTLGSLAAEMLSGRSGGGHSLAETRPDLPAPIVAAVQALSRCERDAAVPDAAGLIAALAALPDPTSPRADRPASVASAAMTTAPVGRAGPANDAVVVVKRPFGYNARLATAIAVIAIIGVLGLLLLRNRHTTVNHPPVATIRDTTSQSAGEVAMGGAQPDTATTPPASSLPAPVPAPSQTSSPVAPPITPPGSNPAQPAAVPPNATFPTRPAPLVAPPAQATPPDVAPVIPTTPLATPSRRRPVPSPVPAVSQPAPQLPAAPRDTSAAVRPNADTAAVAPVTDVCSSPADADQRKCLLSAIDRNDRELNDVYQKLIAALRRQASVQSGDPDPATVADLRDAQRKWVDARDAACRDVGDGPLYAKARAQCFADQSSSRTAELQKMLAGIPDGGGGPE